MTLEHWKNEFRAQTGFDPIFDDRLESGEFTEQDYIKANYGHLRSLVSDWIMLLEKEEPDHDNSKEED